MGDEGWHEERVLFVSFLQYFVCAFSSSFFVAANMFLYVFFLLSFLLQQLLSIAFFVGFLVYYLRGLPWLAR